MSTDFDWVTARLGCTPRQVFERLRLQIEEDVQIRNKARVEPYEYVFKFEPRGDRFVVFVEGNIPRFSAVTFSLRPDGFQVSDHNEKIMFSAGLTLNRQRECRPVVDGEEYELWEVRKMALEKLFTVDCLAAPRS